MRLVSFADARLAAVLGDLVFDDVPVGLQAVIGERGRGFDLVMATLSVFRVSVAGASVGLGQAALREAARHAAARRQFGRPLARLGPIAELLANSWAELEAARLLTYRASIASVDQAVVRAAIERLGPDRVTFGSDWPMADPAAEIAAIRALGFDAHTTESILGRTLASLLGLGSTGPRSATDHP